MRNLIAPMRDAVCAVGPSVIGKVRGVTHPKDPMIGLIDSASFDMHRPPGVLTPLKFGAESAAENWPARFVLRRDIVWTELTCLFRLALGCFPDKVCTEKTTCKTSVWLSCDMEHALLCAAILHTSCVKPIERQPRCPGPSLLAKVSTSQLRMLVTM